MNVDGPTPTTFVPNCDSRMPTDNPVNACGTINAKLSQVGTDAIPEPDAAQLEGNPAAQIAKSIFAGAEHTQNLVFPVTLTPDREVMDADGHRVALSPGMAATVEIKIDSRLFRSSRTSQVVRAQTYDCEPALN